MSKIKTSLLALSLFIAAAAAAPAIAQSDDVEELKMSAIEALISAPPERAMPLAAKVLRGDNSVELKERALFILSQINLPEAQNLLVETATISSGELQEEAIRMIGIGGNPDALARLGTIYDNGDSDVRDAVLEAYLIADDEDAVYGLAIRAHEGGHDDDFDSAVEMLGAMNAHDQLRKLKESTGISESLIEAYAIAGDGDSLRELALDSSDPELQAEAIEALGIVGGDQADATLIQIYKDAGSDEIREAALEGLLISGHDEGVLALYRASTNPAEKKELLEFLVMMGSDEVWDIIESALDESQP